MELMKKTSKLSKLRINRTKKIVDKVTTTSETIAEIEATQKIISETLYIKGNVVVDLQNFSLMSITPQVDIF